MDHMERHLRIEREISAAYQWLATANVRKMEELATRALALAWAHNLAAQALLQMPMDDGYAVRLVHFRAQVFQDTAKKWRHSSRILEDAWKQAEAVLPASRRILGPMA